MLTLVATCLVLSFVDGAWAMAIIARYSKDMEIEEFVANAPLDDVLRVHFRLRSCMLILGMASIFSTNGVTR